MARLNGASSSEVPSCPQTSEDIDGYGHPGASPSEVATATKTDTAGSTASESADPLTAKGSKLSRPVVVGDLRRNYFLNGQYESCLTRSKGRKPKYEVTHKALGCPQSAWDLESLKLMEWRGKASPGLVTGEAAVGYRTRELVLSEAESDTEWYKAIEGRDCKTLIRLLGLKEGSDLWRKTGKAGRTVLHVAAIQGSLELVHTIEDIISSENVDEQSAQTLSDVKDGRCAMNARDIAVHIVGNEAFGLRIRSVSHYPGSTPDSPPRSWVDGYELTHVQVNGVQRIISGVVEEGRYEGLIKSFQENVDYNFFSSEIYGRLFLFHHACSRVDGQDFVEDVIKQCREVSEEQVKKLIEGRDFQGRTPLHVAVAVAPAQGRDEVLRNLMFCLGSPELPGRMFYWGVRDGRGWTPLHLAATQPYSHIFGELIRSVGKSSIASARISQPFGCTAIHLAVLHNSPRFFDDLFRSLGGRGNVNEWNEPLWRHIDFDISSRYNYKGWTVLSLALMLGNLEILELLLSKNYSLGYKDYERLDWRVLLQPTPICLAAAFGNTEILRQLLNDSSLDPFERDNMGRTSLHYAANGLFEPFHDGGNIFHDMLGDISIQRRRAHTYVCVADVPNVAWLDELHAASLPEKRRSQKRYSARKGCINMLLQAGVDVWQKDNNDKVAMPGSQLVDDEFISWWHEKIAKETLDMRNNLNQGGNAISVIGALIATASYVGPLQPPLAYGSDPSLQLSPNSDNTGYAHIWDVPVRVFMVSNSLSFYLAIASIMLAVVPSLPMPQQALLTELFRTRNTVASAICVLLLSVVGILVSYAAASIAVMPQHNVTLTSYPALVGGLACLLGIILFITRVLRLMYPDKCRRFGKVSRACLGRYGNFFLG